MVTFLRPHHHAHGPATVNVRRLRKRSHCQRSSPPSLLPNRCSALRPMAQDPSHPHLQSKDNSTDSTQQQREQPAEPITRQPAPALSPPRQDVQEPSISSSSGAGGSDTSSWLQLGIGTSPGSPSSSSRRKRPRADYESGPSTTMQPACLSSPPPTELGLSLQFPGWYSSASASPVVAAPPPPLHEAGTWFVLRAARNQKREPPLQQIPRSYLRVRDGRMMTVRVVMRYLVSKLGLEDDSQLEITCRGQRLDPAVTLQHIRDNIWRILSAEAAAVLPAPGSPSTNQVMTLQYGRS